MRLPRFLRFEKYDVVDLKEFLSEGRIEIHLRRNQDKCPCSRCGGVLSYERGHYPVVVEAMSIMGYRTFIHFKRYKRHCEACKKARVEQVEWISELSPHFTTELAWWVGRICEISAVTRVAALVGLDKTTTWRLDYHRMILMLQHYRIPKIKRISVDEVYVRRHSKYPMESRQRRYFTIITDLETRKVIWVSEGRSKSSLDSFYQLIGREACEGIEVVSLDQYEGFRSSTEEHCPKATIVLDRFHIIKHFEEVLNETRKHLHEKMDPKDPLRRKTRASNKYNFMKKAERRTESEKRHIEEVMSQNEDFIKLEIIKERMLSVFDEPDAMRALFVWTEIGDWVKRLPFLELQKWYENLNRDWKTVENYFKYRVTTAVSEGINNHIKALIRRGFGYSNMRYLQLKIMQVCGYLNSRFIPQPIIS